MNILAAAAKARTQLAVCIADYCAKEDVDKQLKWLDDAIELYKQDETIAVWYTPDAIRQHFDATDTDTSDVTDAQRNRPPQTKP
jgi:hypothetical protein